MNRPSFQFYPADWLSNKNLKRCSFHHKGIWTDLMCLMHDSEEYGILRWTLQEISNAVGCSITDLEDLIKYGVLKGKEKDGEKVSFSTTISKKNSSPQKIILIDDHGPLYYSSRMVRDEYIRKQRAQHGIKSLDNPNVPPKKEDDKKDEKQIEKDTISKIEKGTFSPSPSSSSSSSDINTNTPPTPPREKEELSGLGKQCGGSGQQAKPKRVKTQKEILSPVQLDGFKKFWDIYPLKVSKEDAKRAWKKIDPSDELIELMVRQVEKAKQTNKWQKDGGEYIPYPASWLNSKRWEDEIKTAKDFHQGKDQAITEGDGIYQEYLAARQAAMEKYKSSLPVEEFRSKFRADWLKNDPDFTKDYQDWGDRLERHFQHKLLGYIQDNFNFPSFNSWKKEFKSHEMAS